MPAEVYAGAIHVADREREREAFASALHPERRALYATEYRLTELDGVERTIRASGRGIFDDAGNAVGFTGVLEDVTAIKLAEREARQRAALAEQLVGIVSHDLRNPLNAIQLATHVLRSSVLIPQHASTPGSWRASPRQPSAPPAWSPICSTSRRSASAAAFA